MSKSCGSSVVNLYLAYFELKHKTVINNSLYYHFIYDVLSTDYENRLTNKLKDIFPNLVFNTLRKNSIFRFNHF